MDTRIDTPVISVAQSTPVVAENAVQNREANSHTVLRENRFDAPCFLLP